MQRRKFSREFKLEVVNLVRERGVTVAHAHPLAFSSPFRHKPPAYWHPAGG